MHHPSHARLWVLQERPLSSNAGSWRTQAPTWPRSVSLAPPTVYFSLNWNPQGGEEGCKKSARRGMTDGRGEAARGRASPSRPGLSPATVPASPVTQAGTGGAMEYSTAFRERGRK